ncbi:MAG: integrase core domain-containing protein, partial [Porticoccaceae bacterium]
TEPFFQNFLDPKTVSERIECAPKMRVACLFSESSKKYKYYTPANAEYFRSRTEAKAIIEIWRQHYNAVRPHSSLYYLTPNEFTVKLKTTNHPRVKVQSSLARKNRAGHLHRLVHRLATTNKPDTPFF